MGSEQCLGILSSLLLLLLLTVFLMVTLCVLIRLGVGAREGDIDADRWSGQLFSPLLLLRFSGHLHWPFAPSPLGRDVVFSSLLSRDLSPAPPLDDNRSESLDGWMDGWINWQWHNRCCWYWTSFSKETFYLLLRGFLALSPHSSVFCRSFLAFLVGRISVSSRLAYCCRCCCWEVLKIGETCLKHFFLVSDVFNRLLIINCDYCCCCICFIAAGCSCLYRKKMCLCFCVAG